jgi:hypothetical protein
LQVLHSADADSFFNALVRFPSRHGFPALLHSDNGSNFVACHKELKQKLLQNSVEWLLNLPTPPHMGGMWERLIATVKKTECHCR